MDANHDELMVLLVVDCMEDSNLPSDVLNLNAADCALCPNEHTDSDLKWL